MLTATVALWILTAASAGAATDPPARAVDTFHRVQHDLAEDKKRSDWNAFLSDAQRQKAFLNGSPIAGLEVARAELELGHTLEGLAETRRFLAMGQTNGLLDSPLFQPQRTSFEETLRSNASRVSLAARAFGLADSELLPEDIDFDPRTRRFFITSILKHTIIALDSAGRPSTFADSPDRWPMVAIKVDAGRRRLWATEVAFDGFAALAASDWGRSVLLEYDLDRGTLLSRREGAFHGNLGDMALAANGDPILSDGVGGGVYRLIDGKISRIDHGDFISPQTVAVCGDGRYAFVPDYVRGIAAFDLETGVARWLPMKDRYALDGIDGLYCLGSLLVAVQNGSSPERVIAFALDSSMLSVTAEAVIERATDTLGEPTHGVFVDGAFFYIANSGWNAIDEHGAPTAAGHSTPPLIMRIQVSAIAAAVRSTRQ